MINCLFQIGRELFRVIGLRFPAIRAGKCMLIMLVPMAAGCAGTGMGIQTDALSGATVIESEKLGVGFFTVVAKTVFSWRSDAPENVTISVYLLGTKNITDVDFNLGPQELKLHTESPTAYRNSGSYSKNSFNLVWKDFMELANKAASGEVAVLVTGAGTHEVSQLDAEDYKLKILPFIEKVKELKEPRSPIS